MDRRFQSDFKSENPRRVVFSNWATFAHFRRSLPDRGYPQIARPLSAASTGGVACAELESVWDAHLPRVWSWVGHDGDMTRELTLPPDYPALLANLKAQVRAAQHRAHRVVNTEMLTLYWQIGDAIRTRQQADGWGTKVVARLAADLRAEFPGMTGLSRSNLNYMLAFATAWPAEAILQQPAGRLGWGHLMLLLDKLDDAAARDWYAAAARRPDPFPDGQRANGQVVHTWARMCA